MNKFESRILDKLKNEDIAEWKKLWGEADSKSIYNSYEWFLSCRETYGPQHCKIFYFYKEGNLLAVVPFTHRKKFGFRTLTSVAKNDHIPSSLLIVNKDSNLVEFIVKTLTAQGNVFLSQVDEKTSLSIRRIDKKPLISAISKQPEINLSNDISEYFSKSVRRDMKKYMKKNSNKIKYKFVELGEAHTDDLNTIVQIDLKSGKSKKKGATFSDPSNIVFFRNIFKYCNKFIRICYLYDGEKPIAYILNFTYGDKVLEFNTAYLAEYYKISPGKVLFYKLVEKLTEKGYREFKVGMNFSGFRPSIATHYDIYFSKYAWILAIWKLINKARRANQIFLKRDYFGDNKFLFKTL